MRMEFYIEVNEINEYRVFYRTGWWWKKFGYTLPDGPLSAPFFHQHIFHTAKAAIDALTQRQNELIREKRKNTWKRYYREVLRSV